LPFPTRRSSDLRLVESLRPEVGVVVCEAQNAEAHRLGHVHTTSSQLPDSADLYTASATSRVARPSRAEVSGGASPATIARKCACCRRPSADAASRGTNQPSWPRYSGAYTANRPRSERSQAVPLSP